MLIFQSQHEEREKEGERERERRNSSNQTLLKLVAYKTKLFVIAWQQDRINALSQT